MTVSRVVCAWCSAELSGDPSAVEAETSHGICLDCHDRMLRPSAPEPERVAAAAVVLACIALAGLTVVCVWLASAAGGAR